MRINNLIQNDNKQIKWIRDEFEKENLFVDNSFQRRYVWLKKHQIHLIETILLGYVIPEIYIWGVGTNPDTGDTKYSIVDGQQRIGAIVDFINDRYSLRKTYLSYENGSYAGKKFSELCPEDKKNIWGYTLSCRIIPENVTKEDIKAIFLRLNSTDKSLNPQELRNAEYNGLFLTNALAIANFDFWNKHNVFKVDSLRRMGDVEFISSILIFFRKGIESEITQEAINQTYDLYNEQYNEAESDKQLFSRILECLDLISDKDQTGNIETYFQKLAHLYTLIVSVYKFVKNECNMTEKQMNNLIVFYEQYEQSHETFAEDYKTLLQSGTRTKQNRLKRVAILSKVIEGEFELNSSMSVNSTPSS